MKTTREALMEAASIAESNGDLQIVAILYAITGFFIVGRVDEVQAALEPAIRAALAEEFPSSISVE